MMHSVAEGMLTLQWDAAGFTLQENPNVEDRAGWKDVPGGDSSPLVIDLGAIAPGAKKILSLVAPVAKE